ncbi:MAG: DUF5596 domain-containing protein [Armatimonadetes bacterium]|nr:DUF5596 domain-containing protein [Armatimonadota bacterium]
MLRPHWDESQRTMPHDGLFFLQPRFIRDVHEDVYLPSEIALKGVAVAELIARDPALSALAWHQHYCLYHVDGYPTELIRAWPYPVPRLGADTGTLYTLVLLSGTPEMVAFHDAHRIPEQVRRDTLAQLRWGIDKYLQEDGAWGLRPHYLNWLMNHFTGRLYHLVRLQFQFNNFFGRIRIYRHREDARKIALSEPGVRYRADGQVWRNDDDEAGVWEAMLSEDDAGVTGNPIDPRGFARREPVTLAGEEWELVVSPGDPVLNIHIPTAGPMDYELCRRSFEMVPDFFATHFPEREWRCICCGSWLLNTALQELLPDTSNMVRFQREMYLFPIGMSEQSLVSAIFDETPVDPATAPRDNTLRRAFLERKESGEPLVHGGGGCFIFMEDFDWGAQVYLKQQMPW